MAKAIVSSALERPVIPSWAAPWWEPRYRPTWGFASVVLVLAVVAFALRVALGARTLDDAYITFRYARNLATGVGFVYNSGEHVLGTTTPLWTLILASLYRLGASDLPRTALILNALGNSLSLILVVQLARRLGLERSWTILVAVLFAFFPAVLQNTLSGMETPAFTLFILLTLEADLADRPILAGIAAGLATLTRPEGVLVGILIVGRRLLARDRRPDQVILAGLAVVLPWATFAMAYFGSFIPESVLAKSIGYQQLTTVEHVSRWFINLSPWGVILLLLVVPAAGPAARHVIQHPRLSLITLFPVLLGASQILAAFHNVFIFDWYEVPLFPFLLLGSVAAIRYRSRHAPRIIKAALVSCILMTLASGINLGRDATQPFLALLVPDPGRETGYLKTADLLSDRLTRSTVVAMPEIGAFGYRANVQVLDTMGLVSPRTIDYLRSPEHSQLASGALPPGLIRDSMPDYIVSLDLYLPPSLVAADWFQQRYHLLATVPAPDRRFGQNRIVLIYERRDLARP